MIRDVLLDTGPLVAVLDRSDQCHSECVGKMETAIPRLITTEAVATEASQLVARGNASTALPLDFLLAAQIPVLSLTSDMHSQAVSLIRRYESLPMDYADATLVVIANALRIGTVFTTDCQAFRAYRRGVRKTFTML